MKWVFVCGNLQKIIVSRLPKTVHTINQHPLRLADIGAFLQKESVEIDRIFMTDEAFSSVVEDDRLRWMQLMQWMQLDQNRTVRTIVLTKNLRIEYQLEQWGIVSESFLFIKSPFLRLPCVAGEVTIDQIISAQQKRLTTNKKEHTKEERKTPSFIHRWWPNSKKKTAIDPQIDALDRQFDRLRYGVSRVVAITGHRGSGVTSTVINLAREASRRGLSVMMLDLDIDYRSFNMYCNAFYENSKKDPDIQASLIRTLAKPTKYATTTINVGENVWMSSLGYEFHDPQLIKQFYTSPRLLELIAVLKNQFQLIVLDVPLDVLVSFTSVFTHIDLFGLCIPNNLHAVISALRNVQVCFQSDQVRYINAKSKLIITQYNALARLQNELLTPDRIRRIVSSDVSSVFPYEIPVAGSVPYAEDFDLQIERDVPLVATDTRYQQAYGEILLRFMEGAR